MDSRSTDMNEHDDTQRIREDIERTQREMSRTIDEIEDRLSPRNVMQRTKDKVRRAGVNRTHSMIDKITANPIPAAMAGIGLLLLMRDNDRGEEIREIDDVAYDANYASDYEQHSHGRMHAMQERVGGAMGSARERVSGAMSSGMSSARSTGQDLLASNPLILGVAALALGAIVGALVPETERENRMFGERRDELMNRGRDLAREGVDRAKNVASTVADRAVGAAKDVAEAAKDAARGDARMS